LAHGGPFRQSPQFYETVTRQFLGVHYFLKIRTFEWGSPCPSRIVLTLLRTN